MPIKSLLDAIHDSVRWVLHIVLIPLIAVLKAVDTGVQHLITELSKV